MHNFPQKFVERIHKLLPESEWTNFFQRGTEPLPKVVRISAPDFDIPPGWSLTPSAIEEAFFIERDDQNQTPLGRTLQHFSGQIYVQSLSSMLPVVALNPQPGEKILDLCAAPGSKTTFMSQKMANTGLIVANEPSGSRSKKLASNLDRLGSLNTVMVQSDGTILHNFYDQEFDRILLDAPCSSEGFGRKDSKFFSQMWSEKKIFEAAKLQKRLMVSAFKMLRPGGIMVYSTCTSAPEENEAVVEFLVNQFPDEIDFLPVELEAIPHTKGVKSFYEQKFSSKVSENTYRIWPHKHSKKWDSESFFLCKIQKKEPLTLIPPNKPERLNPPTLLKKNHQAEILTRFCKTFGIERHTFKPFVLATKEGQTYITTKEAAHFCQRNLYRRFGILMLTRDQNLSTEFVLNFGHLATQNILELNQKQKDRWLQGYDLPLDQTYRNGHVLLIKYQNFCLGWGKVLKDKLKNKLDRDLVH